MENPRVIIIDDMLQTGNTMRAAEELVKSIPGADLVATYSIFELLHLRGAQKLGQKHVSAVKIETLKA